MVTDDSWVDSSSNKNVSYRNPVQSASRLRSQFCRTTLEPPSNHSQRFRVISGSRKGHSGPSGAFGPSSLSDSAGASGPSGASRSSGRRAIRAIWALRALRGRRALRNPRALLGLRAIRPPWAEGSWLLRPCRLFDPFCHTLLSQRIFGTLGTV